MGWVSMSKRELRRVEVLAEVVAGRRSVASAARLLELSERQMHRLRRRFRDGGAGAVAHRARGRPSNNRLADSVREHSVALVRARYRDFGPSLAAEMLRERHGMQVSWKTLQHWMSEAGLWLPGNNAGSSIRRGCGAPAVASWCRSTAASIAGSRIAARPARCWSLSTMRPGGGGAPLALL
jgi:transposase